jgi:DNA ligase 4
MEKKVHQHVDSSESSEESPAQASTGYSLESNGSDDGDRHFQLVFFDVLQVDGRGLLREPYATRRRLLQEVITVIRGFVRGLLDV